MAFLLELFSYTPKIPIKKKLKSRSSFTNGYYKTKGTTVCANTLLASCYKPVFILVLVRAPEINRAVCILLRRNSTIVSSTIEE